MQPHILNISSNGNINNQQITTLSSLLLLNISTNAASNSIKYPSIHRLQLLLYCSTNVNNNHLTCTHATHCPLYRATVEARNGSEIKSEPTYPHHLPHPPCLSTPHHRVILYIYQEFFDTTVLSLLSNSPPPLISAPSSFWFIFSSASNRIKSSKLGAFPVLANHSKN